MDDKTKAAIDLLKAQGFEVCEGVPKWSDLPINELALWRLKIVAWGQDMRRTQSAHSQAIDDEIDRRMANLD